MIQTFPKDVRVLFSNEEHIHISGIVNTQNMRYQSNKMSKLVHEKPLYSDKVTVWCAISSEAIVGPYLFEENIHAVTICKRYVNMIQRFPESQIQQVNLNLVWF